MNTLGIVFAAEFVRRFRSRTYILATLVGAASVVFLAFIPRLFAGSADGDAHKLILVGDPAVTTAARPLIERDFTVVRTLPRLDATPDSAFLDAHGKAAAVVVVERRAMGSNKPPAPGVAPNAMRIPSSRRRSAMR